MNFSFRQWDIVMVPLGVPPKAGVADKALAGLPPATQATVAPHPAVIISPRAVCANEQVLNINVLIGSKKPPAAAKRDFEVLLDDADGLDFLTAVNCRLVLVVAKSSVVAGRGRVCARRREEIVRTFNQIMGFQPLDRTA
jgi:hypothetical protein